MAEVNLGIFTLHCDLKAEGSNLDDIKQRKSFTLNFRYSMKGNAVVQRKGATGFITTQGIKFMFHTEHSFSFSFCLLFSDEKQKYLPMPKKHGYTIGNLADTPTSKKKNILATCMFNSLTPYHGSVEVKSGIKALFPIFKKVTGA